MCGSTFGLGTKRKGDFMQRRIHSRILMFSLVAVLAGGHAFAGELTVNIQQPFLIGGKSFPAGHYRIIAEAENDQFVHIQSLGTKTGLSDIRFDTRLSERKGEAGSVVFDRVGNELYLSEIYIIGMDGFFFKGAPGKHKHLVVKEELDK
jgi:hypothetical protein